MKNNVGLERGREKRRIVEKVCTSFFQENKKIVYEVGFTKKFQNFSKTIITPNYAIFDAQDE